MSKITENLYINFDHNIRKYQCQRPSKEISAVIIGSSGVGKTSLYNHLCNRSEMAGTSSKRITQQVVSAQCMYYPDSLFIIYDTPGLEKINEDKCFILRRTLKYIPFNLVLVMCKLQTRYEDITITQMKRYSNLFGKRENKEQKLVFLVSSVDILKQSQGKNETLIDFMECIKQNKIQEPVILFSNENQNFKEMADILYGLGVQKEKSKVQYNDKDLCRMMYITDFEEKPDIKQRLDKYQNTESKQFLKILNQKSWLENQLIKIQKQESWYGWKITWNIYEIYKNWFWKTRDNIIDRQKQNNQQSNEDEQQSKNDSTEYSIGQDQAPAQIIAQKEQQTKQIQSENTSNIVTHEENPQNYPISQKNQSNNSENIQKEYQIDLYLQI